MVCKLFCFFSPRNRNVYIIMIIAYIWLFIGLVAQSGRVPRWLWVAYYHLMMQGNSLKSGGPRVRIMLGFYHAYECPDESIHYSTFEFLPN